MSDALFRAAIENILQSEGGLSDHPSDPGKLTNYGISLRAYPHLGRDGIRNLAREQAVAIYRRDYWQRVPTDLPDGMRFMVFDAAVNHGVTRALAWAEMHRTLEAYTAARLRFYTSLSHWDAFSRGWARRIAHVLEGIRGWEARQAPSVGDESQTAATVMLHALTFRDRWRVLTDRDPDGTRLDGSFVWRYRPPKLDVRRS